MPPVSSGFDPFLHTHPLVCPIFLYRWRGYLETRFFTVTLFSLLSCSSIVVYSSSYDAVLFYPLFVLLLCTSDAVLFLSPCTGGQRTVRRSFREHFQIEQRDGSVPASSGKVSHSLITRPATLFLFFSFFFFLWSCRIYLPCVSEIYLVLCALAVGVEEVEVVFLRGMPRCTVFPLLYSPLPSGRVTLRAALSS